MSEPAVRPNETTVPLMPCASVEETLTFYEALGFEATYKQSKPYVYLALQWSGFQLHFGPAPKGLDPAREESGGCLVMVDAVAPYHAAFVAAMRRVYGKVLSSGLPRITRYRPGASRFTLMDPSGNSIIFIQNEEPAELEYGGSKKLKGLARALDNARILREFKNDDLQAFRALKSAVRRHGADAAVVERAIALCHLIDLAMVLGEPIDPWLTDLRGLELTIDDRQRIESELGHLAGLQEWLP
ncbi:glyoxalase [Streptosporangium lutulentum]|uniref:Catechol 2,3-dioxygenase-like lactoylglutathione lyase family enzyme n=1 Tax=Streptosporangium lutulentum TaxID=1461250 RepID=A0ABT9Q8L9_9ACTN|nr:glyoxalase [Streptosporangium lutulentum]MDP9842304.1 catechol 2,3-dioxygenase-like lactoylglutathione lyase family enzyme [Streptosporangium lutulentum]